jgi:hypothetical protein
LKSTLHRFNFDQLKHGSVVEFVQDKFTNTGEEYVLGKLQVSVDQIERLHKKNKTLIGMQGRNKGNLGRIADFRTKARRVGLVRVTSNHAAVKLAKGGFSNKVKGNMGG